jgi:hypothetical protein
MDVSVSRCGACCFTASGNLKRTVPNGLSRARLEVVYGCALRLRLPVLPRNGQNLGRVLVCIRTAPMAGEHQPPRHCAGGTGSPSSMAGGIATLAGRGCCCRCPIPPAATAVLGRPGVGQGSEYDSRAGRHDRGYAPKSGLGSVEACPLELEWDRGLHARSAATPPQNRCGVRSSSLIDATHSRGAQ